MTDNTMNHQNAGIPPGAVSLYADGAEEFPVLKAFQQYIDAEQAKARKRLVSMGIFFGVLTLAVIAVFVSLLLHATEKNQALNDRLLEFVMKERDRQPTVVQTPQDNSAVLAMTAKLEELQRNVTENQHKAEKAEIERKAEIEQARLKAQAEVDLARAEVEKAKAEAERARQDALRAQDAAKKAQKDIAEKPKALSAAELEVQKLNALLALEKQKSASEAAKRKEAEIESYRRTHYPELYRKKDSEANTSVTRQTKKAIQPKPLLSQDEIDSDKPLSYEKTSSTPVSVKGSSVDWEIPQ